jgi:large subunit ribosomal protein L32
MAVPKHKTSKSKRDARRTHQKLKGLDTTTCPQCGEPVLPHHVCPECGEYKGRTVIKTDEED